jgi:hypothetical protein
MSFESITTLGMISFFVNIIVHRLALLYEMARFEAHLLKPCQDDYLVHPRICKLYPPVK